MIFLFFKYSWIQGGLFRRVERCPMVDNTCASICRGWLYCKVRELQRNHFLAEEVLPTESRSWWQGWSSRWLYSGTRLDYLRSMVGSRSHPFQLGSDLPLMLLNHLFLVGNLKSFELNHCQEPTFQFHCWVLQRPEPFTNKTTSIRVQLCFKYFNNLNNWMNFFCVL